MTIQETILKFKQRMNKLDTQDYDNLELWDIIEVLNKAQITIVTRLYGQNNFYKSGFEATRKRVDDLQKLVTNTILNVTNVNNYGLSGPLPDDYLHYIRAEAEAIKGNCVKNIRIYQVEESNINTYLSNSHIEPSFLWGEALLTIINDRLKLYTKDFIISNVQLTYLKLPPKMDVVGYINLSGSPSSNSNPIFNDDVMEMIIDEAARIAKGDIQDTLGSQISQQNVQLSE